MALFSYPQPDCIIALNGSLPDRAWFDSHAALPVFAADGATVPLLYMNIRPVSVLGDFDSLLTQIEDTNTDLSNGMFQDIHYLPSQESTDFEKVLEYVIEEKKLTKILIAGLHGGELDHTLNNVSIVMRYGKRANLCIYAEGMYAIPLYARPEPYRWSVAPDTLVSLIPQPMARVSTEGLQWSLSNEILQLAKREGARNRTTAWDSHIVIHEGALLLFLPTTRMQIPIAR